MSRTGIGCRVLIDGAQIDDGCIDWNDPPDGALLPRGIAAAEGLKITWGRKTAVEQPASSSCTFRIIDDTQSEYFRSVRIGSSVQVLAEALISGGGTVPAFEDPDFEYGVRAMTRNATVTRSQTQVETGRWSAAISPIDAGLTYVSQFPPGELEPPGSNPNAWDGIPHLGPGQTWHLMVRVWMPDKVTVTARPLVFAAPWAASVTVGEPLGTVTGPGWRTIEADVTPGVQMGWLGVQIDASGGATWADVSPEVSWSESVPQQWRDFSDVYVDRVGILAPPEGSRTSILVFGGRVSDLVAEFDGDAPGIDVTATDFLGDLGNRFVGDEPWSVEPLRDRVLRVLDLAHAVGEPTVTADIAATVQDVRMTWEDVDHRAAAGLLADMANSVDAVLWSATHLVTGPYVKIEDPGSRAPLYQLERPDSQIVISPIDPETLPPGQRPLELSACDVLRDPVRFVNDVADIATRATVDWQEQTEDDDGNPAPTTRTWSTIDALREVQFGTRSVSIQTLLTTQADANVIADRLLSRMSGQWRMDGLAVTDADFRIPDLAAITLLFALLDGVRRGGLPLLITDLPSWSPLGEIAPAYLEGGDYTFINGAWECALTVSRATGLGTNAAWDQIPRGWTWDQWNPAVTWDQLRGVAAPLENRTKEVKRWA